jgi:hypothetical protein
VSGIPNIDHRFGDGRAEILGIDVFGAGGSRIALFEAGSRALIRISARARERIGQPAIGFMLRNHLGIAFSVVESSREGCRLPAMAPGEVYTVDFDLQLPQLYPGAFSFSPAIGDGSLDAVCDWVDNAITIQVTGAMPGGVQRRGAIGGSR